MSREIEQALKMVEQDGPSIDDIDMGAWGPAEEGEHTLKVSHHDLTGYVLQRLQKEGARGLEYYLGASSHSFADPTGRVEVLNFTWGHDSIYFWVNEDGDIWISQVDPFGGSLAMGTTSKRRIERGLGVTL